MLINSKKIVFINDFKALIKKLELKIRHAKQFDFPQSSPRIKFNQNDFSDVSLSPLQLDALKNIFSSPVSYIWGAAGSGKTRHVLSVAAVNYLLHKKRIIITAPTHVALENALSAIINLSDEHHIPRSRIRRIGDPSEDFSNAYPQCCTFSVNETKLQDLSTKYQHLKSYKKSIEDLTKYSHIRSLLENHSNLCKQYDLLTQNRHTLSKEVDSLKAQSEEFEYELSFARNQTILLQKQALSFQYRFRRFFHLVNDITPDIENYQQKVVSASDQLKELNVSFKNSEKQLQDLSSEIDKIAKKLTSLQKQILAVTKISVGNLADSENLLNEYSSRISSVESDISAIQTLYPSIDFSSNKSIDSALSDISQQMTDLEQGAEIFNDVLLFGITLDNLSSRNIDNISHVFLDEACYSCIAKTSLLYLYNSPITFLGDHMQLPPVCEANDTDFFGEYENMFLFAQNGIYSVDLFSKDFHELFTDFQSHSSQLPEKLSTSSLNQTHRFGKNLSLILDKFIYRNGFTSALDSEIEIFSINAPRISPPSNKRENIYEVHAITSYINTFAPDDYVVLSPYTNQIKLLKKALKNNDNILTVHKSQGQEWNTVILSVTDTFDKYFVDVNSNRNNTNIVGKQVLNTAISRVKKTLVIVCDCKYWLSQNNQLIADLVKISTPIN